MYLHRLTISNVRSIRSAELLFQYPGREQAKGEPPLPTPDKDGSIPLGNVNLILGINGSGKTTVLKSAALALIAPVLQDSGFLPYSLVRRSKTAGSKSAMAKIKAEVRLNPQDTIRKAPVKQTLEIDLVRTPGVVDKIAKATNDTGIWKVMHERTSPAFLVVGYGATRRITPELSDPAQSERRTRVRYQRVRGLFEEAYALIPLAAWLPREETANKGRWTQVVHLMDRALGDDYHFYGEFSSSDGEYLVEKGGMKLTMGALSDGYRAFIGWVGDLLYHICTGCPSGVKLVENQGIVLVDEIDLHLHPEWQRRVIPALAKALPNIQFIFTTHSPIAVGSVEWCNIHVLGADGPQQIPEAVHGLSAEQILLSPYFGLETTRSERKVEQLRKQEATVQAAVRASAPEPGGDPGDAAVDAAIAFMRGLTLGDEDAAIATPAKPPARKARRALPAKSKTRKVK